MGGIISPFVTEPFLLERNDSFSVAADSHHVNFRNSAAVVSFGEISHLSIVNENDFMVTPYAKFQMNSSHENKSKTYQTVTNKNRTDSEWTKRVSMEKSRVYIAFTISGSVVTILAVLFLLKTTIYSCGDFDRFQRRLRTSRQTIDRDDPWVSFPVLTRVLCCVLLAVHCFAYGCVEKIYMMFLMTYVVGHLSWNKMDGSIANAIFWAGFAAGRLAAVMITNWLRPRTVMVSCLLGLISTQGLMLAVEHFKLSANFWWVSFASSGLFIGPLFATTATWIGLNLTPVRGQGNGFYLRLDVFWFNDTPVSFGLSIRNFLPGLVRLFTYNIHHSVTRCVFFVYNVLLCVSLKLKMYKRMW